MSDWSDEMILSFVEAYQNEPCIWNPKDANHKSRQKVNDAWTRISIVMNKTVKDLKNKKETLMSTFRRHFKKKQDSIRSGAGADDIYRPIWCAYDLMESFLGPLYTNYTSTNSIKTEAMPIHEVMLNESPALTEGEGEDASGSDSGQSSTLQAPKPSTSRPRRRPATNLAERQMITAFGQLTNMLAKRQKLPPSHASPLREEDECELYGKLLTQKLRELPPDDRRLMMYDIDSLFVNRIKEKRRQYESKPIYDSD